SIRHRPDDLLASHGLATAALTIPSTEAQKTARLRDKQQRLLSQLRGELTPENPGASTPFARERQRIEAALNVNEFAFRFEQVVSIDVPRLIRQRRNFHSILHPIFQLMRLFLKEKQLYTGILRRFTPSIFPGILVAFAKVLEAAIGEMDRRFREGGSRGLGMALSEGVAALDRIGNFCFTGDPRVLPTKVMKLLGIIDSLRIQLWFTELGGRSIDGLYRLNSFLSEVFYDIWIPETVSFICQQARRGLQRGIRSGEGEPQNANDLSTPRSRSMTALTAWEQQENPFKLSSFEKLSAEVLRFDGRSIDDSRMVLRTRRDFAEEIYTALAGAGKKGQVGVEAIAPTHSIWPSILQAAIQHTRGAFATKEQWVLGIAAAMVSTRIEWVPGSHRRRITHLQVIQLVGAATSAKRRALEAEARIIAEPLGTKRVKLRQRIDLGCEIPFKQIPDIVDKGFAEIQRIFAKGDQHCLGDPLCDLMLILTLTITASSATPEVQPNTKAFSVGTKRRDPALLAANLVIRMLWFLRPDCFPWEKDAGQVLRVSEMTKKIEHKGVNNRLLRELGWIQVKGNRDSPRNCESRLAPREELNKRRRDLIYLLKEPRSFIASVFRDSSPD
ncbi:hypothetical protein BKA60DRAFT_671607, partial [Fusarium oxysporum]